MAIKIRNNSDVLRLRKITPIEGARLYGHLRTQVTKAGILNRDYSYYLGLSIIDISGFVFFVYLLVVQTNPWLVALASILLSIFTVRIGGLIHDAGHRAIFKSSLINDLFGYMCSSVVAFPFAVWQYKHNAHHAHTNEEGEDPDLEVPISFTKEMWRRKGLAVRFMRKYQAWLFYPLGSLVSFTMRFKAFRYYKDNMSLVIFSAMTLQIVGMFVWYVLPFLIFPLWKAILFFILTNEVAGFYMLNIFAPNHKGMPQIARGMKFSFLEHQIMTARNIYGHWMTDYMYMGLNYQIEHHLFPNCPRSKLKKITPFILEICRKYKLNYVQMGPLESSKFILKELSDVSKENRL
ncbi:acyl-CoA desaturase [Candidatus Gottesmanbacteria bacterium]|nr:acyl-CoA desaturase [Candidatus Gottesmanbacteria bacterium]